MRPIEEIIIHCSATPEHRDVKAADIQRWHVRDGYSDIGYHYVVELDGTVVEGRALEKRGAHCKGHNARSIGVCYIGGCDSAGQPKDTRTKEQQHALRELIVVLRSAFPNATIHGHNEFSAKACPSFDVEAWVKTF